MAGAIPAEVIEEIRRRCDIVEVVSGYVSLRPRGRNLFGLCPFHAEKTPSFAVNAERQIFHCFGCHAGGDVFSFLMRLENISFYEAVKVLAERCGVELPKKGRSAEEEPARIKAELYALQELAARYFQQRLAEPGAEAARRLLKERGLEEEDWRRFGLGYAPAGWDGLLKFLCSRGYAPQKLANAGLVVSKAKGGFYDRFRQRLMFPIYDSAGRVVGFGGRRLVEDKETPKYINSPESPIYQKGRLFYGWNWAQEEIRRLRQVVVVEGYFDLIAAHRYGIRQAVAASGTALTAEQVQLLRRMADEVIIFFDADKAGQQAAARVWELFLSQGVTVRVASLEAGEDPDSFLRKYGASAFRQRLTQAVPLVEFVIQLALQEADLATPQGQVECLNQVLPVLAAIPRQIERTSYLQLLAERLRISSGVLLEELARVVREGRRRLELPKVMAGELPSAEAEAERLLVRVLLTVPQVREQFLEEVAVEDFQDAALAEIVAALKAGATEEEVMMRLESEAARALAAGFMLEAEVAEPQAVAADCLHTLRAAKIKAQLRSLRDTLQGTALNPEGLREYQRLIKKLKAVEVN